MKKLKKQITERIEEIERPKFGGGSLNSLQETISDILIKLEELENRIKEMEK